MQMGNYTEPCPNVFWLNPVGSYSQRISDPQNWIMVLELSLDILIKSCGEKHEVASTCIWKLWVSKAKQSKPNHCSTVMSVVLLSREWWKWSCRNLCVLQFAEEAAVLLAACMSPGYSHVYEPLHWTRFATINLVSPHYKKVNRASRGSKPGELLQICENTTK